MNWTENWNPDIGLWTASGPGHSIATKNLDTLHPGTNAATRLVVAAQQDQLDQIDVIRVLKTLRSMQHTEPDNLQGCMKWYWEEDRPYDTNAAFFTGLIAYPQDQLTNKRALISLWAFSLGDPITKAPDLQPSEYHLTPQAAEERAYTLHWQCPEITWHISIDPRATNPLIEHQL